MVNAYFVLLVVVACERLAELVISRRNAVWSFQKGGIEVGQKHFVAMAALHAFLLVGCGVEATALSRPFYPVLAALMLCLCVFAQSLRWWVIIALGRQWNVRVIVVPGLVAVRSGPYRFLRHPNYVAVILEGIALPMIHTLWCVAIIFSVLNAWLLWTRIACEEAALRKYVLDYDKVVGVT